MNLKFLAVLSLIAPTFLFAHGGEEHSHDAPEKPALTQQNRVYFESDTIEAVLDLSTPEWTLFVDDRDHNQALNADVSLEVNGAAVELHKEGKGVYHVSVPADMTTPEATLALVFVLTAISDEYAEIMSAEGEITAVAHHEHTVRNGLIAFAFVLSVLGAFWFFRRKSRATATLIFPLFLTSMMFIPENSFAHGGDPHDHEEAEVTNIVSGSAPKRMPDGQIFIPKTSQRLMNIRTEKVALAPHALSQKLNAQVLANPNGTGLVQASQSGRILPVNKRLPALGEKVSANQVLAYLEPVLSQAERNATESALAKTRADLANAESRLSRLKEIRELIPQKDWEQAIATQKSLQAEFNALNDSLHATLSLRAPVAGVLSQTPIIAGQLVEPGTTIFEISTPDAVLVEAAAYDLSSIQGITAAYLIYQAEEFPLSYIGSSRRLKDQATPVQFKLKNPSQRLPIGAIGSVLIQTNETREGVLIPQTALLRGEDGRPLIAIKTAPETFKLLAVSTLAQPNKQALVISGLHGNERVVNNGAQLLQQVR